MYMYIYKYITLQNYLIYYFHDRMTKCITNGVPTLTCGAVTLVDSSAVGNDGE